MRSAASGFERPVLGERYRVERSFWRGDTSSLWSVRDAAGVESVAKVYDPALPDSDRLFVEAERLRGVRHEHVVAVHEAGWTRTGQPFLIMERLDGESLDERLTRGRLSYGDALSIAAEILRGLEAVHAVGLLHRDVQPDNVFLVRAGGRTTVKLLDFDLLPSGPLSGRTTGVRRLAGAPGYASPEQVRGYAIDARADLYAAGVVFYEMLSGQRPFEGVTPTDLVLRSCTEPPTCLSRYRPDLPATVHQFVQRAIAREASARFPSARAMGTALAALDAVAPGL